MGSDTATTSDRVLDDQAIAERVEHLAKDILANTSDVDLALVGVYTRGVTLAGRLRDRLAENGKSTKVGKLDVSLYRDDFDQLDSVPRLLSTEIPFALEGKHVILVDEVIYTGRTTRAAISGLLDYGRPDKVELAVMVDRGHRELPIQPDYVGEVMNVPLNQYVKVRFADDDNGVEGVFLTEI